MPSLDPAPEWIRDERRVRVFLAVFAAHFGATIAALIALYFMTRGGGDSKPDSLAIDAAACLLKALSLPVGAPLWSTRAEVPVLFSVFGVNSALIGLGAAIFDSLRR